MSVSRELLNLKGILCMDCTGNMILWNNLNSWGPIFVGFGFCTHSWGSNAWMRQLLVSVERYCTSRNIH